MPVQTDTAAPVRCAVCPSHHASIPFIRRVWFTVRLCCHVCIARGGLGVAVAQPPLRQMHAACLAGSSPDVAPEAITSLCRAGIPSSCLTVLSRAPTPKRPRDLTHSPWQLLQQAVDRAALAAAQWLCAAWGGMCPRSTAGVTGQAGCSRCGELVTIGSGERGLFCSTGCHPEGRLASWFCVEVYMCVVLLTSHSWPVGPGTSLWVVCLYESLSICGCEYGRLQRAAF